MWTHTIAFSYLVFLLVALHGSMGFIQCPSNGIKTCSPLDPPHYLSNVDRITISNCVFQHCPQLIIRSSNVTFINVTFDGMGQDNVKVFPNGGALYVYAELVGGRSTTLSIYNSTFRNYKLANGNGGAICVGNSLSDTVIFSNSIFYNNQANSKGGSILINNADAVFQNCLIQENSVSNGQGGAICFFGGSASFDGCQFLSNSGDPGGAIAKYGGSGITINNCYSYQNYAGSGGFIYVEKTVIPVIIENCVGNGDNTWYDGGYMVVHVIGSLIMRNVTLNQVHSSYRGGALALWQSQDSQFFNVSFISTTAGGVWSDDSGGAIYFYLCGNITMDKCTFSGCSIPNRNGGAVSIESVKSDAGFKATNSKFLNNRSGNFGGAISSTVHNFEIYNCQFIGNSAAYGGAVSAVGPSLNRIEDCYFASNQATLYGGSISISGMVALSLVNINISSSHSQSNGGSISFLGPLAQTALLSNVMIDNTFALNSGGAIYLEGDCPFTCDNCQISRSLSSNGGGIFAVGPSSSTSIIRNSKILNSQASNSGGFLMAEMLFSISVQNSQFVGASAGIGAGFSVQLNSIMILTSSYVANVSSSNSAGFAYCYEGSSLNVNSCVVDGVTSVQDSVVLKSFNSEVFFNRTTFANLQLLQTGSYFVLERSNLSIDNFAMNNEPSFLEMSLSSQVKMARFSSSNCYGTNSDSSLISSSQSCTLNIGSGSSITGFSGKVILATYLRGVTILDGLSLLFNNPTDFGIYVSEESILSFVNSQFIGSDSSSSAGLTPVHIAGANFYCHNSVISNHQFGGCGTIYVGESSLFNATSCRILSNSFTYGSIKCDEENSVLQGYGGAICTDGKVELNSGVVLSNNSAMYGGSLYMGPSASVTLFPGVSITANSAEELGGAFYLAGSDLLISNVGVNFLCGRKLLFIRNFLYFF